LSAEKRKAVEGEIADVLIYLVRLADKLDIDLAGAAISKMAVNEVRYPADKVRGSAKKYTEY
jgi:NTP pyrophosphatase (non-canonical NTP hydrolase)